MKKEGNFTVNLKWGIAVLKSVFTLSSVANVLGGAVLFFTWGANWATDPQRHVPLIVFAIGVSMVIQGLYCLGYSLGWLNSWGNLASGALLAGELISGCVGLGMLISGLAHNAASSDQEMAPVIAGFLIGVNALLGLILLFSTGKISASGATRS